MIRLGMIGLGTIFSTQLRVLLRMKDAYRIAAVCDRDPNKLRAFRAEYPSDDVPRLCSDSNELFLDPQIDAVLIAVPPAAHFPLALSGLEHGKHILLEKPATLSMKELESLYHEAELRNRVLHIAYHAAFAKDLEWFLSNRETISREYRLGELSLLDCGFYDPYMENGVVAESKRALGGCFMDSGINALSVCARVTSLSDFALTEKRESSDGLTVCHAEHFYRRNDCGICIRTGWDMGTDKKTTLLKFAGSDGELILDHSEQSVIWRNNGREELLFRDAATPRLLAHYSGVLADFYRVCSEGGANRERSIDIHKLLFAQ